MIPLRDENPTIRPAVVTIALIVINLAIYFGIQLPKGGGEEDVRFTYRWAAVPCEVETGKPIEVVPEAEPVASDACVLPQPGLFAPQPVFPDKNVWLAVFFSMFLHGSILHVGGNMLFLWIFGNNVEDQLGHFWFLLVYLAGGIVASAVHILGNLHSTTPFIGASGAVAVVMGAYIVWFPRARILTAIIAFFFFPVRLPAFVVLGLWFGLQFFTQSSSGIAWLAHVGGFAFGALIAGLLKSTGRFPRVAPVVHNGHRGYDGYGRD